MCRFLLLAVIIMCIIVLILVPISLSVKSLIAIIQYAHMADPVCSWECIYMYTLLQSKCLLTSAK